MNNQENNAIPLRDPLIEAMEAVISDTAPIDRLMEEIDLRSDTLSQWKQSFHQTLSFEQREVQEFCRDAVLAVDEAFEKYSRLLEEIAGYGQSFDKSVLKSGPEKLIKVHNDMNLMFIGFRNDALSARGPSTHSGLNLLINTIDRLMANSATPPELHRDMFMESILAPEALETLNQGEENYFTQGLKYFYMDYSQRLKGFLEELFQGAETAPAEIESSVLERIRKELLELGEMYREFDINHLIRRWGPQPTEIPQLNLVINSLEAFIEGKAQQDAVEYFTDEMWLSLDSARFRYDSITAGAPSLSGHAADEISRLSSALDDMGASMEDLEAFLNEMEEPSLPEEIINKMKTAASEFTNSVKALQSISEDSEKVTCFKCGQKNPKDRMFCTRCRALLPQMETEEPPSMLDTVEGGRPQPTEGPGNTQMTKNVKDLLDTAGAVVGGNLEPDSLLKLVEEMESRLKQSYKYAKEPPPLTRDMIEKLGREKADQLQESLKEAARCYKTGLDTFGSGLALLRVFAATISQPTLEEARKIFWNALENLQQSQHLVKNQTAAI